MADAAAPVRARNGIAPPADTVVRRQGENWVVMTAAPGAVAINGQPVALGIRVLRDRDELLVRGTVRLYFSTESLPEVLPYPDLGRPATCPRCHNPITPGQASVKCPNCATYHHQLAERPCWTYSPGCGQCEFPTELTKGYRWTPAELEA
jgi:hypothetical protein